MAEDPGTRLTVVSLNTWGVRVFGSRLADRYAAIGAALDGGDAAVACLQEVFSWWHLRLLARRMRSFRSVSFRASPAGPAGGLATFRAEYLPAGKTPHCIDFILITDGVKAEGATVMFAGKEPLGGGPGYVSDHVGLRASLFLARS